MTLPRDLIPPSMRATLDAARRMADPFEDVRRQHDMLRASGVLGIAERMKLETPLALAAMGRNPFMDRMQGVGALMRAQTDADRVYRAAFPNGLIEQAERIAQLSAGFALPDGLERFRTPTDSFVDRILRLSDSGLGASALAIGRPAQIEAFARASAMADMFAESDRLTRGVREAVGAFSITEMPQFANQAGYRSFLDAAGLRLAHWPRRRLLTMAEKRRRLKARLQANSAPPHVKRAKTLVHRYELTLREILDAVMAETYGEDWADERLPLCDCKDLLGKWKKRGGEVFDHADYTHNADHEPSGAFPGDLRGWFRRPRGGVRSSEAGREAARGVAPCAPVHARRSEGAPPDLEPDRNRLDRAHSGFRTRVDGLKGDEVGIAVLLVEHFPADRIDLTQLAGRVLDKDFHLLALVDQRRRLHERGLYGVDAEVEMP